MLKRVAVVAGLAAAATVLAGLALVNLTAGQGSAPDRAQPDRGMAGTNIGGKAGFELRVSGLQRLASVPGQPAPPAGAHYVVVRVTFQNSSRDQQRADPLDFHLRDGTNSSRQPVFFGSGDCARWPRTDLQPAGAGAQPLRDPGAQPAGPEWGPTPICFLAYGDPGAALTLIWDPDVSAPFLDSPTEIPLR